MDIDDLLEDSEPSGQHKVTNKKSWSSIAKNKLANIKDDDDDLFDGDDFLNWNAKKKPQAE